MHWYIVFFSNCGVRDYIEVRADTLHNAAKFAQELGAELVTSVDGPFRNLAAVSRFLEEEVQP